MTDRPLFFLWSTIDDYWLAIFLTGFISEIVIRNKKTDSSEIFKKIGF